MSKTVLSIIILAGVVIVFVIARFTGLDSDFSPKYEAADTLERPESEFDTWIKFTPKSEDFTVLFPRAPAHLSEESTDDFGVNLKNYDIFAADGLDHRGYMVEVISFPEGPIPDKNPNILKDTLHDILSQSTQNTLIESKERIFKGENALTFDIESGERKLVGLIFVKDHVIYILTRIAPDGDDATEDYQFFTESITFKGQQNKKDLK